ncbi:MAG: hypothetical protein IPO26_18950 [Saprospiraceae bacterium]|nr:hypothetical protein [Saprospiraceae bacterium]
MERFLFPRSAGRTRMFLFIVSNQAFDGKGEKHNLDAIMEWLDFGFSSLLLQIANTKIDSTFKMHVLVYEYEVTDMNSKGKLNKSELKVIDHLKKAKLWQSEMGI